MNAKPLPPIRLPDADPKSPRARGLQEHENACIVCYRRVNPKRAAWVHMGTDWMAHDPGATDFDSQGCFRIGPECAKRLPKGYTISSLPI